VTQDEALLGRVGLRAQRRAQRWHTEHGEQVTNDDDDLDALRLRPAGQHHFVSVPGRQVRERPALGAEVDEVGERHPGRGRILRIRRPHRDEAIAIRERQGPQQHGVHDAEHRRVRADADRQRGNGDCGDGGRSTKRAQTVAEIAQQFVEPRQHFDVAAGFAHAQPTAELPSRRRLGVSRRHAVPDQLVDTRCDVKGDLLVQGALDFGLAEQIRKTRQHRHAPAPKRA
jgi:hypothetical protein